MKTWLIIKMTNKLYDAIDKVFDKIKFITNEVSPVLEAASLMCMVAPVFAGVCVRDKIQKTIENKMRSFEAS